MSFKTHTYIVNFEHFDQGYDIIMTICETPKTPQKFNFQVATLFNHFYKSKCKHYSPLSKHQHISKNFALNSLNGKQMKII